MTDKQSEIAEILEISGGLDRHAVEVLQLEIRRLATLHSVEIDKVHLEKVDADPPTP